MCVRDYAGLHPYAEGEDGETGYIATTDLEQMLKNYEDAGAVEFEDELGFEVEH